MISGGPVPGGRGVGLIDVDGEEQRDAKYRRETIDEVEITSPPKADGKTKAASAKAKPIVVIELKDNGGSNSPRSVAPRSKRSTRAAPHATGSTRGETTEVEDVVNFGDDEGVGFDVADDIAADAAMDIDQGYTSPAKSLSHQKTKPVEKSKKPTPRQAKGAVTNVDDSDSRSRGPQPRPRSRLARKNVASDTEDVVIMAEGRAKGSVSKSRHTEEESSAENETPSKARAKANRTSRKPRLPVISRENSDSESMPPRPSRPIPGTSTPVKKGMKPKPKSKPKPNENPQLATSLSDDDEIYTRPVQNQSSAPKAKAKQSGREPPAPSSKSKEKVNILTGSSSRSPSPPAKTAKTLKRTVSVLVPSPPKDYVSPSSGKNVAINGKGKSELARTSSIRASATEASTSGSKRGRPSLSKPSTSTPAVKNRLKSKMQSESGPEHEEGILAAIESSSSRGVSKRSAANKATNKLRDEIMPDVVNFEKERKNAKRRHSSGLNDSFAPLRDEEEVEQKRDSKRRRVESSREVDKDGDEEAEVEEAVASSNPQPKARMGATQRKGPKRAECDMSVDEDELSKGKSTKATQNKKGLHTHNADGNQPCVIYLPCHLRLIGYHSSMSSQQDGAVRVMTTGIHLSDDNIKVRRFQ